MNIQQAVQILERHNRWRRNNSRIPTAHTDPTTLGIAIDTIVEHFKSHNAKEPPPKQGKVKVSVALIEEALHHLRGAQEDLYVPETERVIIKLQKTIPLK